MEARGGLAGEGFLEKHQLGLACSPTQAGV